MIRNGAEYLASRGFDPGKTHSVETLQAAGIPVVVQCCGCLMTMALTEKVKLDKDLTCWCEDCYTEDE